MSDTLMDGLGAAVGFRLPDEPPASRLDWLKTLAAKLAAADQLEAELTEATKSANAQAELLAATRGALDGTRTLLTDARARVASLEGEAEIAQKTIAALTAERATLRDEFAKAALQGVLASDPECFNNHPDVLIRSIAASAYAFADGMLEARKQ